MPDLTNVASINTSYSPSNATVSISKCANPSILVDAPGSAHTYVTNSKGGEGDKVVSKSVMFKEQVVCFGRLLEK
jgi:hypothetical protein